MTQLSQINGFSLATSTIAWATGTVALVGDITTGNEDVGGLDANATSPLNRAFADYRGDFAVIAAEKSQAMTVAFSQELLAPPDAKQADGEWTQFSAHGTSVLTATGSGAGARWSACRWYWE